MSQHRPLELPGDPTLVAFLDGELSSGDMSRIEALCEREPAVAQRLEFLAQGCQGLPHSFASLLDEAPVARLHAMLGGLPATVVAARAPAPARVTRRHLLAGAAACLLVGAAGERIWQGWQTSQWVTGGHWRGSVAQYMALYTAQTLDGLDETAAAQAPQLARVGAQLGIDLWPAKVALPGARLRRAQVLRYDSDLIAQLVYLDSQRGPLALCFVRSEQSAHGPLEEVREGLNVVYWQDGRHAWMLIGRSPMTDLQAKRQGLAL